MFQGDHWRPILQQISLEHPDFLVWKHLGRALNGLGDIDAAIPYESLNAVSKRFLELIQLNWDPSYIIVCDHVPGKKLHFVLADGFLPTVPEFDLCWCPSRGAASWAEPKQMGPLSRVNDDGIRGLETPGEALVGLVYHGLSPMGKNAMPSDERASLNLSLEQHTNALKLANDLLVPKLARSPLMKLIKILQSGRWSRFYSSLSWLAFVLSGVLSPGFAFRRGLFRLRRRTFGDCVMTQLGQGGRTLEPGSVRDFVRRASREGHMVLAFKE